MNTANPPPMGQMGCRVGVFVCFYLLHLRVRLVVFSREDACVYVPDGLFLCDFWMCVCVCAHECVLLCVCVCLLGISQWLFWPSIPRFFYIDYDVPIQD